MPAQRRSSGPIAAAIAVVFGIVLAWWLAKAGDAEPTPTAELEPARLRIGDEGGRSDRAKLELTAASKAAVTGTIRDPKGTPIANAQVCATTAVEDRLGAEDRTPHCVRSDQHGRYTIDGLLPIATQLHASAATFKPARWERREGPEFAYQVRLRAGQTTEGIDITLDPGGVLVRGVIKDIAGGEIAGAHVALNDVAFAVSDDTGQFEQWVAPGELFVVAEAEGYAIGWVIGVAPGQLVELFMTPESVLVGRVVLAQSGEPVEGAVIAPGGRFGDRYTARSDADGRFRIARLQPGTYKPSAETDTLYGEAAEQVHLGFGETSEEVLVRVHPASSVAGRVVIAGTEQPCTDGSVRLEGPNNNSERGTTDDEGHVQLRAVLPGKYRVHVHCAGYIAKPEYPDLEIAAANVEGLEWEVREGLAIRGRVVDEAGEGVARMTVSAHPVVDPNAARTQTTFRSQWSDRDGSFELAGLLPGRYELSTTDLYGTLRVPESLVIELEQSDHDEVRVVVSATGTVRGRVLDEDGEPVRNAVIMAMLADGKGYGRSRSNDRGEFELDGLTPGSTRLMASDGEPQSGTSILRKPGSKDDEPPGELVEVVANEVVETTMIVESRSGRITGIVKDDSGAPVVDAFVDVERMSESAGASVAAARRSARWSWGTEPALTDEDGRFVLTGLADGKFIVRANRKGGGDALLEGVALGSDVELVIASTNELSGTVRLPEGGAPERFTVMIEDQTQGVRLTDSFFRTDGVWRFTELPSGRFEIKVSAAEGSVALDGAIELGKGEARSGVELVLRTRVTLRGRVVDAETRSPIAGLTVSAESFGSGGLSSNNDYSHITDADGRFEIENVPIGKVTLIVWSRSAGREAKYDRHHQPLSVAAEPTVQDVGELELVATRIGADDEPGDLGFRINDWDPSVDAAEWRPVVASVLADGPAAASELAAGDVIEKVDGIEVSGNQSRWYTLTRVPVGRTVKLQLVGGKTLELVARPPPL